MAGGRLSFAALARVHPRYETPHVFILAVAYLAGSAFAADPLWTTMTFAIVLAGVPVYYTAFARTGR